MKTARIIASAILTSLLALTPASADIYKWSQTAITNTNSDLADDINLVEGMAPSEVNDSLRALMAEVRKWADDMGASKPSAALMTTGGTANVQTLATNGSAPSLTHGHTVCFIVGTGLTNTSSATLNVDGFGAAAVQGLDGTALAGGELGAGTLQCATYQSGDGVWVLHQYRPIDATTITFTSVGLMQRAALTGDIACSAGSNSCTIPADTIDFTQMANVTSDRLIGRDTAASGDAEELTVGGGIEFTGSGGIQTSALTGDVTKTAGGTATTVAADSVALGTDTTGSYALGDAEAGAATTGDSATSFWSTGTCEVTRGCTGQTTEAEALGEMTQALTEDTTPDRQLDFVTTYDASADTGKKVSLPNLTGEVVLTTGSFIGATLDLPLDGYTEFKTFKLILTNILPTVNADWLELLFSDDGGSTFEEGFSDYGYNFTDNYSATEVGWRADGSNSAMYLGESHSNVSGDGASYEILIHNPAGSGKTLVSWQGARIEGEDQSVTNVVGSGVMNTAGASTDVRVFFDGGAAAGTYTLIGIK